MKRGRKPGYVRSEIQIKRRKHTLYVNSLERFQQQYEERVKLYEAKAKRQLEKKLQERQAEIEQLAQEIETIELQEAGK